MRGADPLAGAASAIRRQYANRRLLAVLFLGFSSGLPLALSAGTLQVWLATAEMDIRTIGLFGLVGLPYTLKFLWSPLMDRFVPPWLGRRRGWMLITQLLLAGAIVALGASRPEGDLPVMAALALVLAFCSASQDIAVDAYRADVLAPRERGLGAAYSVAGYRTALLISSAGALILADVIGWRETYWLMAALMLVGIIATLAGPAPAAERHPPDLRRAVVEPFSEFLTRPAAWLLLLAIVLYKLGDAFAGTLSSAFLIQALEFSSSDVGLVSKGFGWAAILGGAFIGGALMLRLGLWRALLIFGVLQAVSNLAFMALAWYGHSYLGMILAVGIENLAGGMGTAAFVAFLMALCDHRYTATQFALLSALAAIGRVLVGPPAGYLVDATGWVWFFFITFVLAWPGVFLVYALRREIDERNTQDAPGCT
jgi:PAT family beta-lactamase induction signal transducer AmpG